MHQETKDKIFETIDNLLKLSEDISEWIVLNSEHDNQFYTSISNVSTFLDENSFEYKKYDSWKQKYLWKPRTRPWYTSDNKKVLDLISILKEISLYSNIEWEKHFRVNQEYEIIRFFSKLFNKSSSEILIVDNYLDSNIFNFIEEIDIKISILLLTSPKVSANFKSLYWVYKWWNIQCKVHSTKNHDRYIAIDKRDIYLIWASLNGIWKNDFTVKKLDDKNKIDDLYVLWSNSNPLS